jgi:hypothetical protein
MQSVPRTRGAGDAFRVDEQRQAPRGNRQRQGAMRTVSGHDQKGGGYAGEDPRHGGGPKL